MSSSTQSSSGLSNLEKVGVHTLYVLGFFSLLAVLVFVTSVAGWIPLGKAVTTSLLGVIVLFAIEPAWRLIDRWGAVEAWGGAKVIGWQTQDGFESKYFLKVVLSSSVVHWVQTHDTSLYYGVSRDTRVSVLCLRGRVSGQLYPRSVVMLEEGVGS